MYIFVLIAIEVVSSSSLPFVCASVKYWKNNEFPSWPVLWTRESIAESPVSRGRTYLEGLTRHIEHLQSHTAPIVLPLQTFRFFPPAENVVVWTRDTDVRYAHHSWMAISHIIHRDKCFHPLSKIPGKKLTQKPSGVNIYINVIPTVGLVSGLEIDLLC